MRRLAVMAAALLASTAYADDTKDDRSLGGTGEETREAGRAAARDTREGAEQAKDWSKEQAERAEQGTERAGDRMSGTATGTGASSSSAQASASDRNEQARDRMKKDSFDIEGKITKAEKDKLTLQRDDAPAATLHVDKTTRIELDGEQASMAQLKPGQDVQASFNLKGDKPTAVEIKAEKQK